MLTNFEMLVAALFATYFDSKHQIIEDVKRLYGTGVTTLRPALYQRAGKMNFFYFFEDQTKKHPNNSALAYPRPNSDGTFTMEEYSYQQMYDIVLRYARILHETYGVNSGDKVGLNYINKPDMVFLWFAMWSLGATPTLINYNLKDESISHCLKTAHSHLLLVDEEVAASAGEKFELPATAAIANIIVLGQDLIQLTSKVEPFRAPDAWRHPGHKLHDTAMYIYTSGTTGLPKAAIISWHKSTVAPGGYTTVSHFNKNTRLYSAMPLYHSTAVCTGLLPVFIGGGCYIIGHKFSTSTFWTQAKISNATAIQYVGETCRYLLNSPVHPDERKHKIKVACGNGLRPDIWLKFKERFNIPTISEFYGATEYPTALTNYQNGAYAVGAVANYGTIVSTILSLQRWRIAAVEPDNHEELCRDPKTGLCKTAATNVPGEMLFRIQDAKKVVETFQGYTDENESKKKVAFDVFKKGDAWVRTGDLLRRDEHGLVYFVDRMGDTFRWKSENVSTNEVEHAFASIKNIKQVVVVGVSVPNHEGRAGFAVIQAEGKEIPDLKEMSRVLKEKLPTYAIPVFCKFVKSIELTGNNKIQKHKYRNQELPSKSETIYMMVDGCYKEMSDEEWKAFIGGGSRPAKL